MSAREPRQSLSASIACRRGETDDVGGGVAPSAIVEQMLRLAMAYCDPHNIDYLDHHGHQ
jgi:hypothetical protein